MPDDRDPKPDAPEDADKRRSRPPTSRFSRLAKLGALGTKAIPLALEGARRALGGKRDEADEAAAAERMANDARKAAEAMLKTLGEMKGLPLKLGQMASYIDGLAPPGYEEKFQATLKKLQEKAPPLSAEAAEKVITQELGAPPAEIYAEFEREPFAAASIGQVHRALTKGGDRVAVKVQYPGIDVAIENDLKSISLLESFASPVARKYHTKEVLDEIKAVFLAELDYAKEAENADAFRRICADIPGVVIPRVHHGLTTKRVITIDLMGGQRYQDFCETASQEDRNAAGVTIWSFMFRSLLHHGALYADPHPGNYRFLGGGQVGFLDFGCVKYLPHDLVAGMKRYMSAAMDERWDDFDRACVDVLGYDPTDADMWHMLRAYTLELLEPITMRDAFQCSPDKARETVTSIVRGHKKVIFKDGESRLPNLPKPINTPPDFTFVNRLQWGLASVMGGLRTRAKFREITEPWIRDGVYPLSG